MHDFLQTKLYRWMGNITTPKYIFGNLKAFRGFVKLSISVPIPGRPHSSQNEIPCVFPEFFLCYINFPCVIFAQKLTISSMNKGHITTVLLHTEVYKLIF